MRVIHNSHDDQGEFTAGTCDWLEVRRGRTRFPQRPLNSTRCLIGSGTNCHLQLGGDLPMLHSLLVLEDGCWTLDVIAPEPRLFVNGDDCRHRQLCIGDRIQVAGFEFALCRGEHGSPKSTPQNPHHRAVTSESVREEAAGLSASELLEQMEQDICAVDEFEQGRRDGAEALLDAIRSRPVILKLGDVSQSQTIRKAA